MANDINNCNLTGRLGGNVECRYTKSGSAVASFSLANNKSWKGKDDEWQEKTTWFKIVVYGKKAESIAQRYGKGDMVAIHGALQIREWEDDNGNKRQTTEIVANNMTMLGGSQGAGNKNGSQGGYDGQGDDVEEHPADCECTDCAIPF